MSKKIPSSWPNISTTEQESLLLALLQPTLLIMSTGIILNCNKAWEDLYQLPRHAILKKNIFKLCKKNNLSPPFSNLENPHVKDLNTTPIYSKIIQWSRSPLLTSTNETHILIIGFDITDFVNASKQEKSINSSIIDHIPNYYIFWKNNHSVYLGCNTALAQALGLNSSADIIGKTDYDLPTTKEQSDAYRADDQQVMSSKIPKLNIEEQQTLSDGKTRIISTSKTPLFDENGEVYGVLAIYSDITERKNMELSLEKAKNQAETANLAKTEFIINMSHDIRTPLNGIIGISKLLENNAQKPDEKQYARWINESGEQLLSLLNSILDVVSADNIRDADTHYHAFNLRKCIYDIAQLERPTITIRGLELLIEIDEKIPHYIVSDENKLHRVLLNLVGNAIKFTKKGYVKIKIEYMTHIESELFIRFNVIDTGIGIPEELQHKVFDRFYRVNDSFKGTYQGYGVGLHIAQKYIELLGGKIHLSSQLGIGTSFSFTLPVTIPPQYPITPIKENTLFGDALPRPPKPLTTTTQVLKQHVLLVEDNLVALHLIETITAQSGLQFTSTTNGEHALELIKTTPFDFVITDIGLPGISGYDLAKSVREWEISEQKSPMPIIGLTAHVLHETKKIGLQSGINLMLNKPIRLTTLEEIINHFSPNISPVPSGDAPLFLHTITPKKETCSQNAPIDLAHFPLLDTVLGIKNIGDLNLFNKMLRLMLDKDIPQNKSSIQAAYAVSDWPSIAKIAHQIKGSAVYCGTTRLQFSCQYLEQYHKTTHTKAWHTLYQHWHDVVDATEHAIEEWLQMAMK